MRKESKYKVVLDANWYVSACINRKSRRTLFNSVLRCPLFTVYYSTELLREFERVICKPKFRKFIAMQHVRRLVALGLSLVQKVEIRDFPLVVSDVNDNYLFGICDSCGADFLVTGDKVLLDLKQYNGVTILSMAEFLKLITDLLPF